MGALSCGGGTTHDAPPSGTNTQPFTAIGCGTAHACALRQTGEIACWGGQFEQLYTAPEGKFKRLGVGDAAVCGLREDGSIACSGYLAAPAPTGQAVAVTAGNRVCALRADGSVECSPPVDLPGKFSSIDAGDGGVPVCGVQLDQTLSCTPKPMFWDDPPAGTFEQVACASQFCCAIPSEGNIACWGIPETSGERDAPAGDFVSVRASAVEPCAARADGTLACWGGWLASVQERANLPTEAFIDYCTGNAFGCGLKLDGSIDCFGQAAIAELTPPH